MTDDPDRKALQRLLTAHHSGDCGVLQDLLAYSQKIARDVVRRNTRGRSAALDEDVVVQETLIRISDALLQVRFPRVDSFKAWIGKIATHVTIDRLAYDRAKRRDQRRTVSLDGAATSHFANEPADVPLLARELLDAVRRAIDMLQPPLAEIARSILLDDLTTKDVARKVGLSDSQVRRLYADARAHLALLLSDWSPSR